MDATELTALLTSMTAADEARVLAVESAHTGHPMSPATLARVAGLTVRETLEAVRASSVLRWVPCSDIVVAAW